MTQEGKNPLDEYTPQMDYPKFYFDWFIFGVCFIFCSAFQVGIEVLETFPYEMDGQTPYIYINLFFLSICFENKWLYKKIYKKKYGFLPKGLL